MRAFISIPFASLFVLLAAFNAWIMLTGRAAHTVQSQDLDAGSLRLRIYLHRAVRDFCYSLLRIRYRKSAWNVFMTLGVTTLAIAFTLVSMNVALHYLRDPPAQEVPFAISMRVIAAVVIGAVSALLAVSCFG